MPQVQRSVVLIGPPGSGKSNWVAALGACNVGSGGGRVITSKDDATRELFKKARERLVDRRPFVDQATDVVRRFAFDAVGCAVSCVDAPGGSVFGDEITEALGREVIASLARADSLVLCLDLGDEEGLKLAFTDLQSIHERLDPKLRFRKLGLLLTKADEHLRGKPNPAAAASSASLADVPPWLDSSLRPLVERSDESRVFWVSVFGFDAAGRANIGPEGGIADPDGWEPVNLIEPLRWMGELTQAEVEEARRAQASAQKAAELRAAAIAKADADAKAAAEAEKQRRLDDDRRRHDAAVRDHLTRTQAAALAAQDEAARQEAARIAAEKRAASQRWWGFGAVAVVLIGAGAIVANRNRAGSEPNVAEISRPVPAVSPAPVRHETVEPAEPQHTRPPAPAHEERAAPPPVVVRYASAGESCAEANVQCGAGLRCLDGVCGTRMLRVTSNCGPHGDPCRIHEVPSKLYRIGDCRLMEGNRFVAFGNATDDEGKPYIQGVLLDGCTGGERGYVLSRFLN
jgi:hypothetical protein